MNEKVELLGQRCGIFNFTTHYQMIFLRDYTPSPSPLSVAVCKSSCYFTASPYFSDINFYFLPSVSIKSLWFQFSHH